jgi:hypothetical protein
MDVKRFITRQQYLHKIYIEQVTFSRMRDLTFKANRKEHRPYDILKVLTLMQ